MKTQNGKYDGVSYFEVWDSKGFYMDAKLCIDLSLNCMFIYEWKALWQLTWLLKCMKILTLIMGTKWIIFYGKSAYSLLCYLAFVEIGVLPETAQRGCVRVVWSWDASTPEELVTSQICWNHAWAELWLFTLTLTFPYLYIFIHACVFVYAHACPFSGNIPVWRPVSATLNVWQNSVLIY